MRQNVNHIDKQFKIENRVFTQRTVEDEEQIDPEPEQLTLLCNNGEQCDKLGAMRCCNAQTITKHRYGKFPNKQHWPERWEVDKSTASMNLLWKETVLHFY